MRRSWAAVIAGLLAVSASLLIPGASQAAAGSAGSRGATKVEIYATYYGWYDNTPPGCSTAYKPYCAGGTGTYSHPITFASYAKEFPVGTRLYYPTVEKYFVMGDQCQECQADWTGKGPDGGPHLHHVDLWIGGKGGNEFDVINCEDALTQSMPNGAPLLSPFVENPPAGLPVSKEPLFNAKTNHCFGGAQSSASYGRYEDKASGKCLDQAAAKAGTLVTAATCSSKPNERLAYDGAFFVVHHLCMQLKGTGFGSRLDWATCNGNDRQQFETGNNGSIAWIQYLRCVGDVGGRVELAKCNGHASVIWRFHSE
jgi:hypothetical protein